MNPTEQQRRIGQLAANGQNIIVEAGAGCAKSTTLRYLAEVLAPANKNVVVITFNAANAEETRNHPQRPSNLYALTSHALARRAVLDSDKMMKAKLGKWLDYKDISEGMCKAVIQEMEATRMMSMFDLVVNVRRNVQTLITSFCRSSRYELEAHCWDVMETILFPEGTLETLPTYGKAAERLLVSLTHSYWEDLINPLSTTKFSHDVYLKLYQLGQYKIKEVYDDTSKKMVPVDVLCLDEAQDTNPVLESIFLNQQHLQRVVVGDRYQQLYAWRGAGHAMDGFSDFHKAELTESFRFGHDIEVMANKVLTLCDSKFQLIGKGTTTEVNSRAILFRKNDSILEYLFHNMEQVDTFYCSIDLKGIFGSLFHLNSCAFNERPKYPVKELAAITDRKTLEDALAHSADLRRLNKLLTKIIKEGGGLFNFKKKIEGKLVGSLGEAELALTTIHGSKGLEWDEVELGYDFIQPENEGEEVTSGYARQVLTEKEELRYMLYVAVTRARVSFEYPNYLKSIFA